MNEKLFSKLDRVLRQIKQHYPGKEYPFLRDTGALKQNAASIKATLKIFGVKIFEVIEIKRPYETRNTSITPENFFFGCYSRLLIMN